MRGPGLIQGKAVPEKLRGNILIGQGTVFRLQPIAATVIVYILIYNAGNMPNG
jgi:hypothetical protein